MLHAANYKNASHCFHCKQEGHEARHCKQPQSPKSPQIGPQLRGCQKLLLPEPPPSLDSPSSVPLDAAATPSILPVHYAAGVLHELELPFHATING